MDSPASHVDPSVLRRERRPVTSMGQVQAHDPVVDVAERAEDLEVRRRAAEGLDVDAPVLVDAGSMKELPKEVWSSNFRQLGQMEKKRWEESRRRRKEVRRSEKRKREKKEDAGARKGRKVAIHCVFPMICGSGGSKSRVAKAAGAAPAGQMRDEKLQAVVAPGRFGSKKAKNTPRPEHFWKLRCQKNARRCGAKKHISKSKVSNTDGLRRLLEVEMSKKVHAVVARSTFPKHTRSGPLLEVEMFQKCTPLWREAHFQVKKFGQFWDLLCRKKSAH